MSQTLDAIRKKFPAYADTPDDTLARAIGSKFPQYLQRDPDLNRLYYAQTPIAPSGSLQNQAPGLDRKTIAGGPPVSAGNALPEVLASFKDNWAEPFLEIGRQHTPESISQTILPVEGRSAEIAAGINNSVAHAADFFTSPLGIATLGIGGLPVAMQRIVAGAFTAHMLSQAPAIGEALGEELAKPPADRDYQAIAQLWTDAGLTGLFATMGGKHTVRPTPPPAAVTELAQWLKKADLEGTPQGAQPPMSEGRAVSPRPPGPSDYVAGMDFLRAAQAEAAPVLPPGRAVSPRPPGPEPRPTDLDYGAGGELQSYGIPEAPAPVPKSEVRSPKSEIPPPPVAPAAEPSAIGNRPSAIPKPTIDLSTPVAGHKVAAAYDIVELRDLVTSFDQGYDQSLQPRDRSRQASQNQIASIAQKFEPQRLGESATTDLGAPFIDEANQVLSGNGRTAALRLVYQSGKGADYKDWIVRNADRYNLDPAAVAGMENPVLVRRVTDYRGITKQEFARQSNQSQLLGQSTGEKAVSDARLLVENPALLDAFRPSETGDVLAASNRDFLNAFIQGTGDAAELVQAAGGYQPVLRTRVQNAVLGALVGPENRSLLSVLTERSEELGIKTQVNSLLQSAPALVRLKGSEYDLGPVLDRSLTDLARIRQSGEKVDDFLGQSEMFGDPGRTAETDLLLRQLANTKSTKELNEFFVRYQTAAREGLAIAQGGDMFGATPPARPAVLSRAYEKQNAPAAGQQEAFSLGQSPQPKPPAPDPSPPRTPQGQQALTDPVLPHKFKEGQQVTAGVYPMRREGTVVANGPWRPGQEPTYYVKTNLGEQLYPESQLSAPSIQGMGGAIPAEYRPTGSSATAIKNATVDAERAARGLPPAMQAARRDWGTVWDDAMARIDAAPEAQDALIASLKQRPRAITDTENALLLHRQVDLQNEYAKATRDLAQAWDDSQRFPDRLEAVESARSQVQFWSDKLLELYDVNKAVGTETGRGLAARKMLVNEDFTLAKMELEKRAAKGGAPLTTAERAELTRLQQKITETQQRFDDYVAKAEAEKADRAAQDAVSNLIREQAKDVDPAVASLAERITTALEREADKARARLKERLSRLSTGVDPTILYDLSVVGAAKIARGTLDFTRWSREMVADLGDVVAPFLKDAWEASNARLNVAIDKASGKRAEPVKQRIRKTDTTARREALAGNLRQAAEDAVPITELGPTARALAETFIRDGLHDREAIIDAVHQVLRTEFSPDITRRQAMDAISGYGDFKPLNPDAIKAELRDLKGQMQQLAKLEDLQNRQPLLKTGVERRTPTDAERRLIAQVNEAKRRFGVVNTDPARQLKGALDSLKTRLKHQIADLDWQIANRQKIVKGRTKVQEDAEVQALRARRDDLKQQFDQVFPRQPITDAQRIELAKRAVERSIAEYEARIKARDTDPLRQRRMFKDADLDALKARRDALKAEYQEMLDIVDPARRDRAALSAYKRALATSTAKYRERLASGDFYPKPRREHVLDAEALRLKAENEAVKHDFMKGLVKDRLARRSLPAKIWDTTKEAFNLPRTILAAYDVSAVLRQGGFIVIGNPARAVRSIGPMFRALASEKTAIALEQEILSRPNAPLYARSKLYLAPVTDAAIRLTRMEEVMMSRLGERIPGVRASNRAFMAFLNKLRADSFDALIASIGKDTPLNQAELQAVANYINIATGRGNLGKAAGAAETLATAFFSPRLVASRFQILAGEPLYRGSWRTRRAIALEYAKFLTGISVIYALGQLAGADIETDPTSSDFGKLRFGDTRVDILAGLGQNTVLLTRLVTGEKTDSKGRTVPIRGEEVPYGSETAADVIARFLRTKLSPSVGLVIDVASGENVVGEPVTPQSAALGATVPLSMRDIYEVMLENGFTAGVALGVLSMFGFGVQYYESP